MGAIASIKQRRALAAVPGGTATNDLKDREDKINAIFGSPAGTLTDYNNLNAQLNIVRVELNINPAITDNFATPLTAADLAELKTTRGGLTTIKTELRITDLTTVKVDYLDNGSKTLPQLKSQADEYKKIVDKLGHSPTDSELDKLTQVSDLENKLSQAQQEAQAKQEKLEQQQEQYKTEKQQ
ncbi:7588_t:CDS:2 [Ambispora gerdemannii]|uniref:7588_t:CDS:1 n=1 Tax=Ambispora gerdemannii TaxID=144530 RepID=A0A9N8ZU17_9GLOM|nr:7588_t:CDS:2 [Ambispora gerdemannii]